MKFISRKIVSLLVSLFLLVSSMSVGFTAFAAEVTSMANMGSEAIVKNDAQIGTATYYNYTTWGPQANWDDLKSLASEGTEKLPHKSATSTLYTKGGNGQYTYADTTSNSMQDVLKVNGPWEGDKQTYKCDQGASFNYEMKDVFACSNNTTHIDCDGSCAKKNLVVKQYGWDKDGYYVQDYWNIDGNGTARSFDASDVSYNASKLRDESVTTPRQYETYTYEFAKGTVLKDVVFATATDPSLRSSYYEIYATTGKLADLYNEDNLIATYNGVEGNDTHAFATHYTFNEAIEITYVGLKLYDPVSMAQIGRSGSWFNAARIWMLDFYGTEGIEKYSLKTGAFNSSLYQTELDAENNYSIPAALNAKDSNYQPRHTYYRFGIPFNANLRKGAAGWLWDGKTGTDAEVAGNNSDGTTPYDDCYVDIFYDFGDIYEINEVIWCNHATEDLRAYDITFYAGNDYTTLFAPENEIGYLGTPVVAASIKARDLKARYIAARVETMGARLSTDYLRLVEFDIRGKYLEKAQVGKVTPYATFSEAGSAVAELTSLATDKLHIYTNVNGTIKEDGRLAADVQGLYDGAFNNEVSNSDLTHIDGNGKYVEGKDVYTSFTYDLGKVQNVTDIIVATKNETKWQPTLFNVYVSEDATIDESDLVAQVNEKGSWEIYKNQAHIVKLDTPINGRYVELRIFTPTRSVDSEGSVGAIYWRLQEFNVYGNDPDVKYPTKKGALNAVIQTTASEDNYSIPAKLYAESTENIPQHIYYRNDMPFYAYANNVDSRLWDRKTNTDSQFDGREFDDNLVRYEGTHTELFYDFGAIYEINEVIYANHNTDQLRASDMTFYASNDFETLFTEENKLGYEESAVQAISLKTKGLKARYVGISFGDLCAADRSDAYIRACEFDVMGKFSAESDVATVHNFSSYADALAGVDDKTSVVAGAPQIYSMINGVKKTTSQTTDQIERLFNGKLDESDVPTYDLAHADENGNYVSGPDVYTAFKYDLKFQRKITDVFLGNHDNGYLQAAAFKVYVSDDETIDESDLVARAVQAGRTENFHARHATLITLPEGTEGRYVEVRFFMPTKMLDNGQDATFAYTRLKELNVFGDMGYSLKGDASTSKAQYFTKNAENIANSLIAQQPIYKAENVTGINYGTREGNTSKYVGTFDYGTDAWDEFSRGLTETTYYDTDGDLNGVNFTREVYSCGGINKHTEECLQDDTCTKTLEVIDDGSVYQTVIYKLKVKSSITEVDLFHSVNKDRLTSHYLLSFADREEDLFTDAATTFEVSNYGGNRYNLVKLNQPVTARYFAVKILCGVQPNVITSNASNYGRLNHVTVIGEEAPCEVHTPATIPGYEATCTTEGLSEGSECTECGTILAVQEKIEPLGHLEVKTPGYAPTCLESGLSEGIVCERCKETIQAQEPIEPTGHDPVVIMGEEPTCTETGLTEGLECGYCGQLLAAQDVLDALGHDVELVGVKEPTESEDGYTGDEVCKRCQLTLKVGSTIPKIVKDFIKSVTLDGEINCINNQIKVLFQIPVGKSDIQGMQLRFTIPQGFTLSDISTPLAEAGWTVASKLSTGFVILRCGNGSATLESVAKPDALDKYHVLTLTLTPTGTASAGQQTATVLVEDVTTGYVSNPNSTPTSVSFNYVAGHTAEVLPAKAPTCIENGLTQGEYCSVCGEVSVAQQIIPALGHKAGDVTIENKVDPDCVTNGSYDEVIYCTVCKAEVSRKKVVVDALGHTPETLDGKAPTCTAAGLTIGSKCSVCDKTLEAQQEIAPLGHDWKIDAEREVKYCANNCGAEEIPVYVVRFYGRSERLLYETAVEIGEDNMGYLTDADIASANAVAPYLYGYDHIGWDIELSTNTPIEMSRNILAVYQRETKLYNTVVEDTDGTVIETKELEFDQRFVVESETAKSFLVNGQVVGGQGNVTLYSCGSDLTVTVSENEAPEEISVALLKTDAELVNGKYVYRVFLHVYNPLEEDVSEIGVMFAPGSAYTTDANFTMETLDTGKYITLPTELETNDVLATFTGIKAGVTRVVRAYAKSGNTTTYSNLVVKHTFN